MPHVITQNCCNDASCVAVCPVNCIHPTPDDPDYATAEILYIDPDACIDCGACIPVCPVDAIVPDYDMELPAGFELFERLNAAYYEDERPESDLAPEDPAETADTYPQAPLRVAVVGAGPAAWYAAEELLTDTGLTAQVDMFERLCVTGGLARFGVAPDHQSTKGVQQRFQRTANRPGFRLIMNVEVGRDVTHAQLAERYHAVIYATGAMQDKSLSLTGEDLPGSHSAAEFVAWYNGHPDYKDRRFDLSGTRAVVLGNGNVALDVARLLARDPEDLAATDIADHALEALRQSNIREVVVVGRRGAEHAAFTTPELIGLSTVEGLDVRVHLDELSEPGDDADDRNAALLRTKMELLTDLSERQPMNERGVTLRFLHSPTEIIGEEKVEAVRLVRNELVSEHGRTRAVPTDQFEELECDLVIRAVGYQGRPIPGVSFDDQRGAIPNQDGRVTDPETGEVVAGVYTAGWIKRGPSGVIGTNRRCARETVARVLEDWSLGRLAEPTREIFDVAVDLPESLSLADHRVIDEHERTQGTATGRPRVKLVDHEEMIALARQHRQAALVDAGVTELA